MIEVVVLDEAERGSFEAFIIADGPRLRRVLYAHFGPDFGAEATSEAFAYAWQHWAAIAPMDNRVGYLYRVAQSATRRHLRWRRPPPFPSARPGATRVDEGFLIEPRLAVALSRLSARQRTAVVLVYSLDWSQVAAAEGSRTFSTPPASRR